MKLLAKISLILSILIIVLFANFYNIDNKHVWNLIYYSQYYLIVGLLISYMWILFSDKLIRVLTIPIGVYYLFHLVVNFIEIFNQELKQLLYQGKYINYLLAIALGLSMLGMLIILNFKKWKS